MNADNFRLRRLCRKSGVSRFVWKKMWSSGAAWVRFVKCRVAPSEWRLNKKQVYALLL